MTKCESTHYLRLRWTACYMLFDDDRFFRANTAFLNMSDQIEEEVQQSSVHGDDSWLDRFNLSLAGKIEHLIGIYLQESGGSRAEVEAAIAEKMVELAKMYE